MDVQSARGGHRPNRTVRLASGIGGSLIVLALAISPAVAHTTPFQTERRILLEANLAGADAEETLELDSMLAQEDGDTPDASETPEATDAPEAIEVPEPTDKADQGNDNDQGENADDQGSGSDSQDASETSGSGSDEGGSGGDSSGDSGGGSDSGG
jgi:uncharacterized membrane protein YgcG